MADALPAAALLAGAEPMAAEPAVLEPVAVIEVTAVAIELPSLETRIEWYNDWEEKTAKAQELSRRDRQYYDNVQWTQEELEELKKRHQPPLVKNRIARKVNFILGEEIRKRVDPVARPRTPQHEDAARAATDALRYASDEQRFNAVRSAVLKNVLIEGYGGALKEMDQDEDGEYHHKLRHIEWDRLFYDPHSRSPDFSDALYRGIVVWMDLEDAVIQYPDAADALRAAVAHASTTTSTTTEDTPRHSWADRKRSRVKLVEMYFRIGRDWYRSVFTQSADVEPPTKTFILDEKGRHSVCPLPMWSCYVDSDGMRYGVVRQLISPQDEINKRSSKALHLLSVNGVIAEEDAIRDPTKFQIELAKPDGFATGVRPGALESGAVKVRDGGQLAQGQLQLLQEAKQDIDTIGPSSASLPDLPAATSGRAFIARQQAASQELGTLFDQLKDWTHAVFELDWLCIRQWWTEERWLRVTDDQELTGYRFVALNRQMTRAERLQELLSKQPAPPLPKALEIAAGTWAPIVATQAQQQAQAMVAQAQQMAQLAPSLGQQIQLPDQQQALLAAILQHPAMAERVVANQVDQMLVDIVIDEAPDTAVLAQEEFDTLAQLMPAVVQARPDAAPTLVKLLIKASSLPDKRELLRDLEKAPDPAAMQAQEQARQMQQAMAQLQLEIGKANIAATTSKVQLQQAQTAKTAAEAQSIPAKLRLEAQGHQADLAHTAAQIESERAQAQRAQAQAIGAAVGAGEKMGGMMGAGPGPMMPPLAR